LESAYIAWVFLLRRSVMRKIFRIYFRPAILNEQSALTEICI